MSANPLRKRISKKDHERVLLTDVLPYELPIGFGNVGLFARANGGVDPLGRIAEILTMTPKSVWTTPLTFKIAKGLTEVRKMYVVHPIIQLKVATMYEKYRSQIVSLCRRSRISLRHPEAVGAYWYERKRERRIGRKAGGGEQVLSRASESAIAVPSTFFAYGPYSRLDRFETSGEMSFLERSFKYMMRLDVSHCFPSIYTHSIEWAVKGREHAKSALNGGGRKKRESFEATFDSLMCCANDGQTAGIVVGPEFSRIFAEIIFQALDGDVEETVRSHTKNVEIRRWVDDYFVFGNSLEDLEVVQECIAEKLSFFNLRLSESKAHVQARPFVNQKSCARSECNDAIRELLGEFKSTARGLRSSPEVKQNTGGFRKAPAVLLANSHKALKRVLSRYQVSYEDIGSSLLHVVRETIASTRSVPKVDPVIRSEEVRRLSQLARAIYSVSAFIACCSNNLRCQFHLSEIVLDLLRLTRRLPKASRVGFHKYVASDLRSLLLSAASSKNDFAVKNVSLLITLSFLGDNGRLDSSEMETLIKAIEKGRVDRYFYVLALLHHIGEHGAQFKGAHPRLLSIALDLLRDLGDAWPTKCEAFMLVLDLGCCPFLTTEQRKAFLREAVRLARPNLPENQKLVAEFAMLINSGGSWYFDWRMLDDPRSLLRKKDLHVAY